jgi:hypothetical protein
MLPAFPVMAIIGLMRGFNSSAGERLLYWQYALEHFTFFGNGLPFHYPTTGYAHNLIIDVLYVAGLPGLALLVIGCRWLWRERSRLNPYHGFIAGFCVYSLVDYPHWSVPGAVLMIILSKYGKDQKNYGKLVGSRIRLFILARAGNRPGLQRGEGLVAIPDSHRTQ